MVIDGMASGIGAKNPELVVGRPKHFSPKRSVDQVTEGLELLGVEPQVAELQTEDGKDLPEGRGRSAGEMKMKMRNLVMCAMAIAAVPAYGEPIDLGCSARGPLAALTDSVAFREAIGAANPANFLGSVYDVNGLQLSSATAKSMRCPLFIDSDASSSASASKAILRAEASAQAVKAEEQTVARVESKSIVVLSAAGEVARLPQPETNRSEVQAKPQEATKAQLARTQSTRVVSPASSPAPQNSQLHAEVSQAVVSRITQEQPAPAAAVWIPRQVEATAEQSAPAAQTEQSWALSVAQATRLIRQVKVRGNDAVLEFNPAMVLFDFTALFGAILACGVLVFNPRPATASANERRDLYSEALTRIDPERVLELSDWSTPQTSKGAADPSHARRNAGDQEIPAQVA
jgi:hypothetical protein